MRLEGKTAIITGAGGGIGRAVAQCFAEEGATIVLNGRRVAPLFETRDLLTGTGAEVIVQPGDVSVRSDCQSVVEAARLASGRVDILVNNAAVDQEVAFIEMTEEGWDEVIDINLKGPFLMSQAVARVMASAGGGSIIHISSIDRFAANGLYSSYNVSKNGLMGLSRCIAVEMASRHIRSNVVSPGATDTEMIARAAGPELMDYMRDRFDRVPMRRLIATREIAQACLFLASDESSGMTGAELVVDGGAVANMYMFETIPEFPAGRAAAPSY
jgi:NAD(P)-dependent dehydrogenase (short-subunit alcohol dehydrogenase family)